jgi:hypothetical protein
MGGLALKNTFTRRYQREEYDALEQEVFAIVRKTFKRCDTPRFFASKESFGDMDLIVSMEGHEAVSDGKYGFVRTYIEETFKPNEIFHNGHCYSFDYKELQIDFMVVPPEDYDSNYHYLAFNDLGNFIGRIAQSMGLKYGQEGLWYNHFQNDQKVGKIMISKDYPKIFEFLGLSYEKWVEGFDSLEEIFEYIIQSPNFGSELYQMSNLNKINRERNLKRKSYMGFLDYIAENHPNVFGPEYDKAKVLKDASTYFDCDVFTEIKRFEYEHAESAYAKSKFNGGMVMRKYDLKGKELGIAMDNFKEVVERQQGDYKQFIINSSMDRIYCLFDNVMRYNENK